MRDGARISGREFDGCTFRQCDFSQANIDGCSFLDCVFEDCNLSNAKLPATGLKNITFKGCKLLGIRFDACDDFLFEVSFSDCTLDYSWFAGKKIAKTAFRSCSLKSVNFENTDLAAATFDGCHLEGAVFLNTNLKKADFSGATGFSMDPEANILQGARFRLDGISGLLGKYGVIVENPGTD